MVSSDHEFGGVSTDLKLSLVEGYLRAFTTALRPKFDQLWYIDAFAGTGERTVKHPAKSNDLFDAATEERVERHRGSAKIAIDVVPAFDRLVFMDERPRHCRALRELQSAHLTRQVEVVEGDANEAIVRMARDHEWTGTRAVMFLDPFGMSVDWTTLEVIKSTGAIDVWYLVSVLGILRQAARRATAIDGWKQAAITRMLGYVEWQTDWYRPSPMPTLFQEIDEENERFADVAIIERSVLTRLKSLFPCVLPPLRLNNDQGVPQFALFFAISNHDPKAIGLATRIAGHILNAGRSSQVLPL